MGLKTNSKKAIENIRAYIMENFEAWYFEDVYQEKAPVDFSGICKAIYNDYVKYISNDNYYHGKESQATFFDYTGILPSMFNCSFRLCNSVHDLSVILEQTEQEAEKYKEDQAEKVLSYLIYRELKKEV